MANHGFIAKAMSVKSSQPKHRLHSHKGTGRLRKKASAFYITIKYSVKYKLLRTSLHDRKAETRRDQDIPL